MFDKESMLKTLEGENRTQIVVYHHEGGIRLAKFVPGKGLTEVGNFDSRFWGYKFDAQVFPFLFHPKGTPLSLFETIAFPVCAPPDETGESVGGDDDLDPDETDEDNIDEFHIEG